MADFSSFGVVITDNVITAFSNAALEMTFVSDAFIGATLSETSDSFVNGGMTGSLFGDTMTFPGPAVT